MQDLYLHSLHLIFSSNQAGTFDDQDSTFRKSTILSTAVLISVLKANNKIFEFEFKDQFLTLQCI